MSIESKLHEEIEKSRRAKLAYDNYLAGHIEKLKSLCLIDFINCSGAPSDLSEIWTRMQSLIYLETSIKTDMETGRMAEIQLNQNRQTNER